jgi:hypothetical protein
LTDALAHLSTTKTSRLKASSRSLSSSTPVIKAKVVRETFQRFSMYLWGSAKIDAKMMARLGACSRVRVRTVERVEEDDGRGTWGASKTCCQSAMK